MMAYHLPRYGDGVPGRLPLTLARRITPFAVATLTSPRTRSLRRALAELGRRVRRAPRLVHYFHQADDPYGQLTAQILPALVDRYQISLVPHLVAPPSDAAAPERERLAAFARRDAADVAPGYGLAFPANAAPPAPGSLALAERVLAHAIAAGRFAGEAAEVGRALWSGDPAMLEVVAARVGAAACDEASAARAEGTALRERLGHYLGAMFHYAGEWYWGVDRLHHLERRLAGEHARRAGAAPIVARPEVSGSQPQGSGPRLTLEFFASLRSPYTFIAMERVYALPERHPVDLVLRPVLPMVMRGLPVPRAKQLYITLDTKREAEDAGVDFGRICDPVGRPVERAFSLYPWANERGRAAALLLSFARAAFAEGVDTGSDAGLRSVVERAGLPWAEARAHLDRPGWQEELEENRRALFDLGLWGVPSFRLSGGGEPPYTTWGQDRLWRVEQEIRRRHAIGAHAHRIAT
jgi:2-hydroxychromene-2-carboxylate isomerase